MSETEKTCPKCGSEQSCEPHIVEDYVGLYWKCGSKDLGGDFRRSPDCCILALQARVLELEASLADALRQRDYYHEGYDLSPVSAQACPGCVYENGKFIRECGLHKRLCDERDRADGYAAKLQAVKAARTELCELFDCPPDRLKQEIVEAREMWDRIARLAGQKQKDAEAKLAAATKRAEEAEKDNARLRKGIEEVREGCIQAAGNWNSESGVELASTARELAALRSLPAAEKGEGRPMLKAVAAGLSDMLRTRGHDVTVWHSDDDIDPQLFIGCRWKSDVKVMPTEYHGIPVRVDHIGQIKPVNHDTSGDAAEST